MDKWIGEGVVVLGPRYIWRGTLDRFDGPCLVLTDAHQVTYHGLDAINEELPVGEVFVPAGLGPVYLQSATKWCPK